MAAGSLYYWYVPTYISVYLFQLFVYLSPIRLSSHILHWFLAYVTGEKWCSAVEDMRSNCTSAYILNIVVYNEFNRERVEIDKLRMIEQFYCSLCVLQTAPRMIRLWRTKNYVPRKNSFLFTFTICA